MPSIHPVTSGQVHSLLARLYSGQKRMHVGFAAASCPQRWHYDLARAGWLGMSNTEDRRWP